MNLSIAPVLALAGVLLILVGIFGLLAVLAVPGWPLIIVGVLLLVVAGALGGRFNNL